MSSTFTLPLRLNTRQTPNNDGSIAPGNTGAAQISQQAAIAGTTPATMVIPAGSIIHSVTGYITTAAGSAGTPNVTVDGVVVGTLSNAAGVNAITFATGSTAVAKLANVGDSDVVVSFTGGASSVGTLSVQYTGRNQDGTIIPYGSGYTNS